MKKKINTVILAGGKGSRMKSLSEELKLPKHLFPLNSENITSRLLRQIKIFSEKMLCVVNYGQKDVFKSNLSDDIEIIEKLQNGAPFISDFQAILDATEDNENLLITTGDLVFDEKSIFETLNKVAKEPDLIHIITDFDEIKTNHSFPIRLALLPRDLLTKFCEQKTNPEDIKSVLMFVFRNMFSKVLQGQVKINSIKTIANLNTPAEYNALKKANI